MKHTEAGHPPTPKSKWTAEAAFLFLKARSTDKDTTDAINCISNRLTTAEAERNRKVEAYDAARAKVKREGFSRAEYVLRAAAAEARVEAALAVLDQYPDTTLRGRADYWAENFGRLRDAARAALACPPQQRGEK